MNDNTPRATYYKLKSMNFIPILTISVLENLRKFNVLDMCIKIFEERTKRLNIKQLNEVIKNAIEKRPPPSYAGKKISIKFGTQVSTAPPIFLLFVNDTRAIRNDYKRYIEKTIRKNFGFKGVPIIIKFKKKKIR